MNVGAETINALNDVITGGRERGGSYPVCLSNEK